MSEFGEQNEFKARRLVNLALDLVEEKHPASGQPEKVLLEQAEGNSDILLKAANLCLDLLRDNPKDLLPRAASDLLRAAAGRSPNSS